MEIAKALPTGMLLSDRYRILQILGEGGMSRVYLADDTRLNTRVAVKENLQISSAAQTQFQQEAQILARLSHPNLPRVMDHFVDSTSGRQYLVMDYVEGEDLESIIKRQGPLAENVALAWVKQVLEALEYLHGQKPPIVHRDVKPGNVKITPEGKAVLVDFGLAKVYDPRSATLTGARAVTPGYAPPEQYGLRTSERSDIYGLGATLYTALTGNVPPEAPLRVAGEMALVSPRQIMPRLSPATEQAVMRAMELDTQLRWQTVSELRASLEGRVARGKGIPGPAPRQRSPALIWGMGIGLAVVLVAAVLLFANGKGVTTITIKPTPTSTPTATPTDTPVPRATSLPPTSTPMPPTSTPMPPTFTPGPPTSTPVPPTSTPVVPTPKPLPKGPCSDKIIICWTPPDITGVFRIATDYWNLSAADAMKSGYFTLVSVVSQAPTSDIAFGDQAAIIEDFVARKCDVIGICPIEVEVVIPAVKKANEAGIPVIVVNLLEPIAGVEVASYIGFDNTGAGRISGFALVDYFGGPGVLGTGRKLEVKPETYLDLAWWEEVYKTVTDEERAAVKAKVAIIEGVAGSFFSQARLNGFHSIVDEFPGIEIVGAPCVADWNREKGIKCAEDFLTAYTDLDGIWAASNEMGLGAMFASEAAGRLELAGEGPVLGDDKVAIFTNDVTPESADRVAEGKMVAETHHGFPEWGWYGTEFGVTMACGGKVPPIFDIRPRTMYQANARLFYPQPALEPIDWKTINEGGSPRVK